MWEGARSRNATVPCAAAQDPPATRHCRLPARQASYRHPWPIRLHRAPVTVLVNSSAKSGTAVCSADDLLSDLGGQRLAADLIGQCRDLVTVPTGSARALSSARGFPRTARSRAVRLRSAMPTGATHARRPKQANRPNSDRSHARLQKRPAPVTLLTERRFE